MCEGVRESLCTREDNHPFFFPALQSAAVSAGFCSGLQDLRFPIASMELRSVCAAL